MAAYCALIQWSVRLSDLKRFSDPESYMPAGLVVKHTWCPAVGHSIVVTFQADFLNHAVEAILALYADGNSREDGSSINSVIIVGHSMGGLVARYGFMLLPTVYMPSLPEACTRLVHLSSWIWGRRPVYSD